MVFAAAGFLFALVSLAIPVWLHLRRSQSGETKPVASLLLLRSGEDPLTAQRRIKDWLLLLLRIGLLLLLILAFAQPVLRGLLTQPATSGSSPVMIVVDVSASMAPHLQGVVDRVRTLASDTEGEVALISAAAELTVLATPDADPAERRAALSTLEVGATALDFAGLPARLSTLADSMSRPDQRMQIHLISDFQSSGIPSRFNALINGLRHPLTLHPVSSEALPNWWIESLSARELVIRSSNTTDAEVGVRIVFDGLPVHSERISLPASGERRVPLPVSGNVDKPVQVAAYIDPPAVDALPADNGRFHVSRERGRRAVAVFGNPSQQRYVRTALSSADAGRVVEDRNSQLLIAVDPAGELTDLIATIDNGARALVFAGAQSRSDLMAAGAGITPIENLQRPQRSRLNVTDAAHPLSDLLAASYGVTVFNYLPMAIAQGEVLISLDNGDPWLMEIPVGQGRMLLVASSLDPRDSNFAANPVFVSFVTSALSYLADDFVATSVDVGSVLRLPERGAQIIDADGARLLSLAQSQGSSRVRLVQPGIYQLRSSAASMAESSSTRDSLPVAGRDFFAANVPLQESDLTLLTPQALQRWRAAIATPASAEEGAAAGVEHRDYDLPLARWLLIAGMLALMAEFLRANGLPSVPRRSERV